MHTQHVALTLAQSLAQLYERAETSATSVLPIVCRGRCGRDGGGRLRGGWGELWEKKEMMWGRYVWWPFVEWLVVGVTVQGWQGL